MNNHTEYPLLTLSELDNFLPVNMDSQTELLFAYFF